MFATRQVIRGVQGQKIYLLEGMVNQFINWPAGFGLATGPPLLVCRSRQGRAVEGDFGEIREVAHDSMPSLA
jgi:hypothetical protein